jgi:CheY-like chemotaxis protein
MGGSIGVTSKPGEGSTFWFTAKFQKRQSSADQKLHHSDNLRGTRVLVVDDHAVARDILRAQLTAWQMEVDTAESGAAAITMAHAAAQVDRPYQIIVLDQMMQQMTGVEVAAAVRKEPRFAGAKLLMLTPLENALRGEALRAAGFDGLLTKPIHQSQTFDTLVDVLNRSPRLFPVTPATGGAASEELPHSTCSGARILLVEDNEINQMVAEEILRNAGFVFEVASDGHQALNLLGRREFDLVLMDCQMPGMDGFETTQRIRAGEAQDGKRVPIVALTANAIQGDRERCLAAGMDAYVTKPIDATTLTQTIDALLKSANVVTSPNGSDLPIDVADLLQRCGGKPAFVEKLLVKFTQQVDGQIAQLRQSLDRHDALAFRRMAHTLKGVGANLSADKVRSVAARLEKLSEESFEPDALQASLAELTEAVGQCVRGIPAVIRQAAETAAK